MNQITRVVIITKPTASNLINISNRSGYSISGGDGGIDKTAVTYNSFSIFI